MKTHEVINLIWGTRSFAGTEAQCRDWVQSNYDGSMALLLLDIRPIS